MTRDDLISYPIQLRPNVWAHLYLPPRITREDVARMVRMLEQLPARDLGDAA